MQGFLASGGAAGAAAPADQVAVVWICSGMRRCTMIVSAVARQAGQVSCARGRHGLRPGGQPPQAAGRVGRDEGGDVVSSGKKKHAYCCCCRCGSRSAHFPTTRNRPRASLTKRHGFLEALQSTSTAVQAGFAPGLPGLKNGARGVQTCPAEGTTLFGPFAPVGPL